MKRILVPVDFSEASLNALEFAIEVANRQKSVITLLHIFTEYEYNRLLYQDQDISQRFDETKALIERKLATLAEESRKSERANGLAGIESVLRTGDLIGGIADYVKEEKQNLVIMGTTGVSDVVEQYVGSNTERVIEEVECPVICVPQGIDKITIKKVVYASDYSEEDKIAINFLIAFAQPFNAEVHVVHVTDEDNLIEKAEYSDFKEEMNAFLDYPSIRYHLEVLEEDTEVAINNFMLKHDGDLLMLLRKHQSFFTRLFTKSITKRMSYFTDYPLLIMKL
ncbi:universal stress protein [Roseivirga sp. BDSF3-8]|uniref:universal stress protein n=1 Tax=Roseivirga sp. BDSF3-8 TaxID=3241598 RepID=UPI003531882A